MSEFKLTTVEEFEEATARLLETGARTSLYYCSSLFFLFCITNYYTLLRPSLHES